MLISDYFVDITVAKFHLKRIWSARELSAAYNDKFVFNDEMNFPYEIHARFIYDLLKTRHSWVQSFGFERVRCTVIFSFTGSGRKLPLGFIFKGQRGKRLATGARMWRQELLLPGEDAWFWFNPKAFFSALEYAEYLKLVRAAAQAPYTARGEQQQHFYLQHDRAPAHNAHVIASVLSSLDMNATLVPATDVLQLWDLDFARDMRAGC